MIEVRKATHLDALLLPSRLRKADVNEVIAAGGGSPQEALARGFLISAVCNTIVDDRDEPIAMFGVVESGITDLGWVWLLGSDAVAKEPMRFLRGSRVWLEELHRRWAVLGNAVDIRNTLHIRWLKWLGFRFLNAVPGRGPGNIPFLEFVRHRNV